MISLLPQLEQLTLCRDVERLDEMFVDTLLGLFLPAHVVLARCVGDAGDERWLVTAQRGLQDSVSATQPPACSISLKSLPHLHDCPSRQRCVQTHQPMIETGEGDEVTMCLPLFNPGAQAAVVELLFKDKPRAAEIDMLEYVVRVMANHYALLEYAQHDTLTGLLNRKTFDESFLKASMPAHGPSAAGGPDLRRDKAELGHWLAIIDIDHFKSINDRFGHLIGDEVLLLLARIMRRTFRFQDRLYRFGGEEFLVLLRCDSDADANAACHRLLDNVQSQVFPRVGQVTVSIGFTEVEPGVSPSLAFARADQAVYFAKQNGRNRVCSYSALVREGELKDSTESGEVELF